LSFRALFKDDIKQIPTVMELAHFLVVKNYSLLPTFQDLYTAFLLFLTLPVTVATAERSFSKLKLIKTYLRNTMQDDRLSGRFCQLRMQKHGNLMSAKLLTILQVERHGEESFEFDVSKLTWI